MTSPAMFANLLEIILAASVASSASTAELLETLNVELDRSSTAQDYPLMGAVGRAVLQHVPVKALKAGDRVEVVDTFVSDDELNIELVT